MSPVVGRKDEQALLGRVLQSKKPEFMAIYGRRRVGKTHLVRQTFNRKVVYFEAVGVKDGSLSDQLAIFTRALSKCFFNNLPLQAPSNWLDALELLTLEVEKLPKSKKVVIFFDELPWLATKRSGMLQALDYYWNSRWSLLSNVKLFVCGSAASWMLTKIINAKGGLHNRLTKSLLLKPFNLGQTKQFLLSNGIKLSEKQILDLYLVMGGVPYYLEQYQKSKSLVQNIESICFSENGLLREEFERLFSALFDSAEACMKLIRFIASKNNGMSRNEIIQSLGVSSGGGVSDRLYELEAAGFIQSYIPYGKKSRDTYLRVSDEYSLFYLRWIEPQGKTGYPITQSYWHNKVGMPAWNSWSGYAFEGVCLKHVETIRQALGLSNIGCAISGWRYVPAKGSKEQGAQIDLLFDRDDGAVTLCEIKYSSKQFIIDKSYAKQLVSKMRVFETKTKTKKELFFAMVTTIGLKKNIWSEDLVTSEVTLADLFR